MAQVKNKAGKVLIVMKGQYFNNINYEILDVVSNDGGSYISLKNDNLGNPLTDTTSWRLLTKGIKQITQSTNGRTHTYIITYTDGTTFSFDVTDGYTPVKGVDYFTQEDINSLNIPRNTSDLTNNSGFITKSVNDLDNYTKSSDLAAVATSGNYNDLNNKPTNVSSFSNDAGYINKNVNNLTNYTLKTNTGSLIDLEINGTTYVVTLSLKDVDGNVISTDTIDLPLESVVVGGSYDSANKKIVLTLENGHTVDIPVGALISGLQTEITSSNKLASDLVDDTNSGNKFTSTSEKSTWNAKYDKPSGGIPKTDLASDVQTSLGKADTSIQTHQDISGKEDKQNKTNTLNENSTNNQYPSAKAVYDEIKGIKKNVDDISARTAVLENKTGKVYGVRRKITNNTSPAWERIGDSSELIANATKDGTEVQNDFDSLYPWSDIISFNLDLTTGQKTAYYGDTDFKFDGSNGDVYTHIPRFWYKTYQEDDYDYILIADYPKSGFTEAKEFDIARYLTGIGQDGKLHSYSGINGADFRNIVTYRNLVINLGNDYCLMDWRYFLIQLLYLVEYANYNSQSVLGNGCSSMRHNTNDAALVEGTNTTSFVVNTAAGNAFVVGQQVRIGTYESSSALVRTITAINDYSSDGITGKEIVLDEEVPSITSTTKIWTGVQAAGQCDALGMKSGCLVDDQKHNVIYRGIEGIFGNIYAFVDGINIKDRVAYVCYDPSKYESNVFDGDYEELGYTNDNGNGYVTELGFDSNHPLVRFPTARGGSTTTGTTDYYYQDAGNRVARVGGNSNGGAYCGLWCWYLYGPSSHALWPCGARVLKYQ